MGWCIRVAGGEGLTSGNRTGESVVLGIGTGRPVGVDHPAHLGSGHDRGQRSTAERSAGNVVEMAPVTGAEDFSYFANQVPGFYFFVGATPAGQDANAAPSNHSPKFFLDEGALAVGTAKEITKRGGDSWFFITDDYAFGHSLERDASAVITANGGKVLGSVKPPLANSP